MHVLHYQDYHELNWCPVIISTRQQVSSVLLLAVISLLIDQIDGLLRFKFSVGCKLMDRYDIMLILITKVKRFLQKNKNKYTMRYWIPPSNLVDYFVCKALINHPLDRRHHFFAVQSYFPWITPILRFSLTVKILTVCISLYLTLDRYIKGREPD